MRCRAAPLAWRLPAIMLCLPSLQQQSAGRRPPDRPAICALSGPRFEIVIGTDENAPVGRCSMPVTGPKTVKNRVHLDLTTGTQDRQEIERLVALGACRVDIGQSSAES